MARHLQLVSTRELIAQGVKTSDQARREFGTDLVLEGSLQQDGARIRITWSLVDPRSTLKSRLTPLTGDADDIFGLQDNLFAEVLEKLPRPWILPDGKLCRPLSDTKPAAYDFYLRGRGYLEDYQRPDNIESAIAQFEQAIAVDGNYAPAYAAMGLAYTAGFQRNNRSKEWLDNAKRQCERALGITPQLAEGHSCLGNVFFSLGRYEDAVQQFQRSLDLDHTSDETLRLLAARLSEARQGLALRKRPTARRSRYVLTTGMSTTLLALFITIRRAMGKRRPCFKKAINLAPLKLSGLFQPGRDLSFCSAGTRRLWTPLNSRTRLRPSFESYGNLGAAYFYMRRYQDSADNLQQALKIDDKDWLNWGILGDTLYQIPSRRHGFPRCLSQRLFNWRAPRLEVNPKDSFALAFTADYYAMLDQDSAGARTDRRGLWRLPRWMPTSYSARRSCTTISGTRIRRSNFSTSPWPQAIRGP